MINPAEKSDRPEVPRVTELEINTSLSRKIAGWAGYLLLFVLVAATFVYLFVRFTGSIGLAIAVVGFMLAYMTIMGIWAGRNLDERN